MLKFADDTTVIGLISDGEESTYRSEVEQLVQWCEDNNLILNTTKTKELNIDYRKRQASTFPSPLMTKLWSGSPPSAS
jgi:DNA gyrase inhibitor GyrI